MEAKPIDEWLPVPKEEVTVDMVDTAIKHLHRCRLRYADAKKISDDADAERREQEAKVLAMLTAINKKKYFVDGVGTVSIRQSHVWRTPKTNDEKQAFFSYIKGKYGNDTLVGKLTVNSQSLNSFCKEEMEAALSEGKQDFQIPGLEEPIVRETVSLIKPRS